MADARTRDVALLGGSLIAGTLLTAVVAQVAFVRWGAWGSGTSLGPLAMIGAAVALVGVPVAVARRRRARWPLVAIALGAVAVAAVFFALVWPEVRDRL
jgi:ABC-type Fe3+-siderophore transport system permease subunit